jgi:hypothetical protein
VAGCAQTRFIGPRLILTQLVQVLVLHFHRRTLACQQLTTTGTTAAVVVAAVGATELAKPGAVGVMPVAKTRGTVLADESVVLNKL